MSVDRKLKPVVIKILKNTDNPEIETRSFHILEYEKKQHEILIHVF
jgi:hypothetical protein